MEFYLKISRETIKAASHTHLFGFNQLDTKIPRQRHVLSQTLCGELLSTKQHEQVSPQQVQLLHYKAQSIYIMYNSSIHTQLQERPTFFESLLLVLMGFESARSVEHIIEERTEYLTFTVVVPIFTSFPPYPHLLFENMDKRANG